MIEIILSTRNPSKVTQIKPIFASMPVAIITLEEAGIEGEVTEDGATLGENAAKKARYAWERSKRWSMADDTGLYITALQGAPGIHAARWAGETATTEEIMNFTLEKLKDVRVGEREAVFKTCAVLFSPDGVTHSFVGEVSGVILRALRVPFQPKMPYSGIFLPDEAQRVWAEMTTDEENAISHRGKAFRALREFLKVELARNP